MECENELCIYCREGRCELSRISIDSMGLCTQCIYPSFPPEVLERAKGALREKLEGEIKTTR